MLADLLQYNLQPFPLLRLSVLHSKNNPYFKYTTHDNMKFLKEAYMNSQGKETVTELNSLEPLMGKHDVDPLNLCPFNLKGITLSHRWHLNLIVAQLKGRLKDKVIPHPAISNL